MGSVRPSIRCSSLLEERRSSKISFLRMSFFALETLSQGTFLEVYKLTYRPCLRDYETSVDKDQQAAEFHNLSIVGDRPS